MKVELQCGDSITIPEGCKAIVKDESVVFEKEEKVQEFKEGDVLHSVYSDITLIFEKYNTCYSFTSHYSTLNAAGFDWAVKSFRHATKEEKAELFAEMKKRGLQWNAEEKRVEKIRWRAKKGGDYYLIDIDLTVKSIDDTYSTFDNKLWDALNHFRTKEYTAEAARRVREVLRQYHEEIGE